MTQTIRKIDSEKSTEANHDYINRVQRDGANLVYDATLDTLFIEIGGPGGALSEHMTDNVMMCIDPDSLQIVGIEILDFLEDFLPNNRLVAPLVREFPIRKGEDFETNPRRTEVYSLHRVHRRAYNSLTDHL